jgi:hypothetical protein
VAKINVKNSSATDIKGVSLLKMGLSVEDSFYLINNNLSNATELNNKLDSIEVVNSNSLDKNYLSFDTNNQVLGLAVKLYDNCYMIRKDYEGNQPVEVWSIATSGECSGSRAIRTSIVNNRGQSSDSPVILG